MDIVVKILKFYKEQFVNLVVTVNIIQIVEFVKVKQYSNYFKLAILDVKLVQII